MSARPVLARHGRPPTRVSDRIDGPPEKTTGARYGVFPVLRSHLAADAVVIADNAHPEVGKRVPGWWTSEYPLRCRVLGNEECAFAVLEAKR